MAMDDKMQQYTRTRAVGKCSEVSCCNSLSFFILGESARYENNIQQNVSGEQPKKSIKIPGIMFLPSVGNLRF
jgi:hypothetical protein